ncbi:MAG: hypothetical protein QMB51_02235 [Patescibacteria group bacterium]
MKKITVVLLFVFGLLCENVFSQAQNTITLDSFTKKLLNEIKLSSSNPDELVESSKSLNTSSSNNELIASFQDYSVIYNASNHNNYEVKIAYFSVNFISRVLKNDFSNYTAEDFKKFFSTPNGKPRDSGFDTVGYITKYSKNGKDYDIEMYLFFNKNDGKLNFVAFQF